MKRTLRPSEHALQASIIDWWAIVCKRYGLPELALFAIPNAAKRSFKLAAYMKAEGLRAGIPDLFLAVALGAASGIIVPGLFIELKTGRNKASLAQIAVAEYLRKAGYDVVFAWSFDEAVTAIRGYLKHAQSQRQP